MAWEFQLIQAKSPAGVNCLRQRGICLVGIAIPAGFTAPVRAALRFDVVRSRRARLGHHYQPSPTPATRLAGVFLFGAKGGPGGAKKAPALGSKPGLSTEGGGWGA